MLKDDGGQHQYHKGAGQPTGLLPQFVGKLDPQVRDVFAQAGGCLRQTGIQVIFGHGALLPPNLQHVDDADGLVIGESMGFQLLSGFSGGHGGSR
jgi:hypothetical protein